jgi:O-acetylserine/cysteine efflux transporter
MAIRDQVLVFVVCAVWAFNFISGAKGMEVFSPLEFMALRFALLLTLTFPFLRRPAPGQWMRLAAVCLLMGAMHFTLLFWALKQSADVTSIVILQHMYIPFSVLLAVTVLGEHAGWRTLGATAVAFSGVLVIGLDPLVLKQPAALTLVLLSAFLQALGSVFMRGLGGIQPLNYQAWTAIFSLPVMIMASLLFEDRQLDSLRLAGPWHWGALAYSTIMASMVGHGLFFWLAQRNPLPDLMPYLLFTPVLGTLFGVLVWGDRPGWRLLVGGALVMAGLLVITLRGRLRALRRAARRRAPAA